MKVLAVNSGSSSLKSSLYEVSDAAVAEPPEPLWEAEIRWDEHAADGGMRPDRGPGEKSVGEAGGAKAMERILKSLRGGPAPVLRSGSEVGAVGHRVVYGGPQFEDAAVIDEQVKRSIAGGAGLAPLHSRAELEGIELVQRALGEVTQIAVFDAGFHRTLPPVASVYPGPYEWLEKGIRRYGFHGISHQYCAERAARLLGRKVQTLKIISCHLGSGCSLAAIDGGRSIDTTMGFTPLDGLMMGTRCGSLDPGILTYLMKAKMATAEELDSLLNRKSGLRGISGIAGDLRAVLAAAQAGHERARLAVEMFVYRVAKGIAAMACVLGGVHALVFTAGIGEHSPEVRAGACSRLRFLGIDLDQEKNLAQAPDQAISSRRSKVTVMVIRGRENWAIAKSCAKLLSRGGARKRSRGSRVEVGR